MTNLYIFLAGLGIFAAGIALHDIWRLFKKPSYHLHEMEFFDVLGETKHIDV